ncbi:hypothetical protein L3Q82_003786 [Scortum barcoo]|uniref:Uncharacterized protein n=1 Tax=Scortum barcoo TaxID=214431 RepID=A0ACB8X979_9TELE|nr:hypothetical protein L3Q82_003786 [Scortum barcoo]
MRNSMMLHLKKRSSKSGLNAHRNVMFYHTAVLLLLTHCCAGKFQVVGPSQTVIVMMGDNVILPCHLKPASDAVGMTFEWARPDLNPRFVHVWHEHQDLHVNQHPSYKGRTSVSTNKLKNGDISLKLSKVKFSDMGMYRCYFPDLDKYSTVQLIVGTASSPVISLVGVERSSNGVILNCGSKGWYPEPEVLWLDGEGNLLSAGPPETVRGPDDLYTVSSRVTVEKRHSNRFTCRVQQKNINQTREAHIHVPDDFFMAPSSSAVCLSISLVACVMCVLAVVFSAWNLWRQNKIKNNMTQQREKQRLLAESEKVKMEEEHKDMVDTLLKQEEELKNQRDQLNVQKKKIEELVDSNERKLQTAEKEITEKDENKMYSSSPGYLKLKEIISNYKWQLTERQKALDQLILNTDELLIRTDGVIVRSTEKKKEAEKE